MNWKGKKEVGFSVEHVGRGRLACENTWAGSLSFASGAQTHFFMQLQFHNNGLVEGRGQDETDKLELKGTFTRVSSATPSMAQSNKPPTNSRAAHVYVGEKGWEDGN